MLTNVRWTDASGREHHRAYDDERTAWNVVIGLTSIGLDARVTNY